MELKEIALEVARELSEEGFSGTGTDYTLAFYPRFLAAVDAERGKDAVAWRNKLHTHSGGYFSFSERKPDCSSTEPLFLSPTIPEGMARVPIEPTQEMCEQAYYEFNAEQKEFDAANLYRAMIHAAGVTK